MAVVAAALFAASAATRFRLFGFLHFSLGGGLSLFRLLLEFSHLGLQEPRRDRLPTATVAPFPH